MGKFATLSEPIISFGTVDVGRLSGQSILGGSQITFFPPALLLAFCAGQAQAAAISTTAINLIRAIMFV
jgi:hypothetical protein